MAVSSPQKIDQVATRPETQFRFNAPQAPKVDGTVVSTISSAISYAKAREEENIKFVRAQFQNMADGDRVNAQAEVTNAEGENALSVGEKAKQKLQESLMKKMDAFDPKYRPYLEVEAASTVNRYNRTAVPWIYGQAKKVREDVFKSRVSNELNDAVESSGDLEYTEKVGIPKVEESAEEFARMKYGNVPELIDNAKKETVSKTLMKSVEQQTRVGRVDLATETIKKFNDRLTPADRVKAIKIIDSARKDGENREALTLANVALDQANDDLVQAEEFIRASAPSYQVYSHASTILKNQHAVRQKNRDMQDEKIEAEINRKIRQTGAFDPDLIAQLSPTKQDAMWKRYRDNRGVSPVATDWKEYRRVREIADNDPERFKDMDLDSLSHVLAPKELSTFEGMQSRLKGAENAAAFRLQRYGDKIGGTIIKQWLDSNEIYDEAEREKAYNAGTAELNRVLDSNPKIQERELRNHLKRALKEHGSQQKDRDIKVSIFGKELTVWSRDPETVVSDTLAAPAHPSVVAALKQRFPNWTDEQISKQIEAVRLRGKFDVTKPVP